MLPDWKYFSVLFFSCSRYQVESVKHVLQAASFCQSVTLFVPHKLLTAVVSSGWSDLCLLQIAFPTSPYSYDLVLSCLYNSFLAHHRWSHSVTFSAPLHLLTFRKPWSTPILMFLLGSLPVSPPLRVSFTLPLLTPVVTSRLLVAPLTSYLQINLDSPLVLSQSIPELPFKSWSLLR